MRSRDTAAWRCDEAGLPVEITTRLWEPARSEGPFISGAFHRGPLEGSVIRDKCSVNVRKVFPT